VLNTSERFAKCDHYQLLLSHNQLNPVESPLVM
jgi:hypothetical protein